MNYTRTFQTVGHIAALEGKYFPTSNRGSNLKCTGIIHYTPLPTPMFHSNN